MKFVGGVRLPRTKAGDVCTIHLLYGTKFCNPAFSAGDKKSVMLFNSSETTDRVQTQISRSFNTQYLLKQLLISYIW